ncbi:hypothetical protein Lal_00041709 [Lupinus albus]|nr:hypothetical protein Lal_00041709 [Lupinus albus]
MTCNPNWPEIVRILKPMGLKPHDRPYIISRVFQMKFEELLHDLKKKHVLGLVLSDEKLQNLTLVEIEKLLQRNRRSLRDYPPMPYPKGYITSQLCNRLIYDELNYDTNELKENFNLLFQSLTNEQCKIFKTIMEAVNQKHGCMFSLYGYGGTGKTHMQRTLTYALRSQKKIVLTIASSGIASLLLLGGRTSHSKFKIPVPSLENSICNIHQDSELAGLLKTNKILISLKRKRAAYTRAGVLLIYSSQSFAHILKPEFCLYTQARVLLIYSSQSFAYILKPECCLYTQARVLLIYLSQSR